jgi:predicted PurR-regulated permease PerM
MSSWWSVPAHRYRAFLVVLMTGLLFGLLAAAWTALVPFFLGLALMYVLFPMVNLLDRHAPRVMQRRRWSRPVAIVLSYIVVFGVVGGLLAGFVPVVVDQGTVLVKAVPRYYLKLENLVTIDYQAWLDQIPDGIAKMVSANLESAAATVMDAVRKGLSFTFRTVTQTISFVIGMVIVPFWLFYVMNDAEKARRGFYQVIPQKAREDVRAIVKIVNGVLSAYVRGQALLCVVVGVLALIVLFSLGVDFALVLGTIAGITEIIPVFGPYMGAIPAVLIALAEQPIKALWVALAYLGIQQIENLFLVPRISGNAMRFHPAVVMVIIVIGSQVGGIWGMLLGVPLSAIVRDLFKYLYVRTTERGATPEMALECLREGIL